MKKKLAVAYYEGIGDFDIYHGVIKEVETDYYFGKHKVILYVLTWEPGSTGWTATGDELEIRFEDFVKYFRYAGTTYLN